jgi:hypothetical protein
MKNKHAWVFLSAVLLLTVPLLPSGQTSAQGGNFEWKYWDFCSEGAFSVEVDFVPNVCVQRGGRRSS